MSPHFTSPPDQKIFQALVWEIVRQIPAGKVATYGQIAALIPPPEGMTLRGYDALGARWVGGAMAACPPDVPWQRVINAQGKISLRQGAEQQRQLLEAEGVTFDERERVSLSRYKWGGPPHEWLLSHGLLPPADPGKPHQIKMEL
jgi:methylated-DNA-protein-cysteine methyltransferase-like protein